MPNYRPGDVANLDNGVLISYEIRKQGNTAAPSTNGAAPATDGSAGASYAPASPAPPPVMSLSECETLVVDLVGRLWHTSGNEQTVSWTAERMSTPFLDLGLDSLDLERLGHQLDEQLPFALPSTILFDYASPTKLAAHIHALLADRQPTQPSRMRQEHKLTIASRWCGLP